MNKLNKILNNLKKFGIFTEFYQRFAVFPKKSTSFDISEHVREIPTKFHQYFEEKLRSE